MHSSNLFTLHTHLNTKHDIFCFLFSALCYNSKISEAVVMEPNVREPNVRESNLRELNVREPRRREDEMHHEPRGEKQKRESHVRTRVRRSGVCPLYRAQEGARKSEKAE